MKWIDKIPLPFLIIWAVLLGPAPFYPEPHLVEKTRMLLEGNLSRPIDIFDLFWHGVPVVLLVIQLIRMGLKSKQK